MPAYHRFDLRTEKMILKEYKNGKVQSAENIARTYGCSGHAITNLLRRHGVTVFRKMRRDQTGSLNHMWKGGKKMCLGYVLVLVPDHPHSIGGYVREHRLVMEKHLSRLLKRREVVHHKNGVKTDNRIENLELHRSTKSHMVEHAKTWKRSKDGKRLKNNSIIKH